MEKDGHERYRRTSETEAVESAGDDLHRVTIDGVLIALQNS